MYQNQSKSFDPPVYINYVLYEEVVTKYGSNRGTTYNVSEAHYQTVSDITKSSETANWNDNLIYIPHRASYWTGSYYTGKYVVNADYYGFYLNYKSLKEPDLADGRKNRQ